MRCYRCESSELPLATLWPHDRVTYEAIGIVLRQCLFCGLEQNHIGDDETLAPAVAARMAPSVYLRATGYPPTAHPSTDKIGSCGSASHPHNFAPEPSSNPSIDGLR